MLSILRIAVPFLFTSPALPQTCSSTPDSPNTEEYKSAICSPKVELIFSPVISISSYGIGNDIPYKVSQRILFYLDCKDLCKLEIVNRYWNTAARKERDQRRTCISKCWNNFANSMKHVEPGVWRGVSKSSLAKSITLNQNGTYIYRDEIAEESVAGDLITVVTVLKGRWELVENILDREGMSVTLEGNGTICCEFRGEKRETVSEQREQIGLYELKNVWVSGQDTAMC